MWQNCQSKSFQHNETNTVSVSLSVYCHSSSSRYFKFDFKTLCTPVMPEHGFSCQQWCHYWCWKCVHCTCEMQEPRRGRVPLLKDLKLGYWSLWHSQYSMAAGYMWQEVHGGYDRHSSGPLTAGWKRGNCRQAFSYMFEAHNITVAVHPLQSNDRSGLETFKFRFVFSQFRFSRFVFFRFVFVSRFLHFRFHLR